MLYQQNLLTLYPWNNLSDKIKCSEWCKSQKWWPHTILCLMQIGISRNFGVDVFADIGKFWTICLKNCRKANESLKNSNINVIIASVCQHTSIYFRKQDDSYFRTGVVSVVPLRCNSAIFNKITKYSPDSSSQSPRTKCIVSQSIPVSQAKYLW